MGPESDRTLDKLSQEAQETALVHDTISISSGTATGLAVILEAFPHDNPERFVGGLAWVDRDNQPRILTIQAVRDHGATISLFFEGLTKVDIPIGSQVRFAPRSATRLAAQRPATLST